MNDYKRAILAKIENKKSINHFTTERLLNSLNSTTGKMIIYNGKSLRKAFIIDLLHSIIYDFIRKKKDSKIINSSFLKNKYGMYYKTYLMYLIDNGHINCIGSYVVGQISRNYKFISKDANLKVFKNTDNVVMKKYRDGILKKEYNSDVLNGIEENIKDKLIADLCSLTIDYDYAISILNKLGLGECIDENNAYIKNLHSITAIYDNDMFYKFDEYGRFHTNFTNLKSEIRDNCVYIDGEKTAKFDIKNSQPLFFLKILDKKESYIEYNERDIFYNNVLNGTIYEYIQEYYPDYITNRKMAKKFIYNVLFGQNRNTNDDKLFRNLFPTIHNYIKSYKNKRGNYRILAHDLQRLESNFIYNVVVKRIMETYPHIPLYTVHDSIHVKDSDHDSVSNIFYDELNSIFNYSYSPSNLSPKAS